MAEKFVLENCAPKQMQWRNFSGRPDKYHQDGGYRSFKLIFDPEEDAELVAHLVDEGWNVRFRPSRYEDQPDIPELEVAVSYKKYDPVVVRVLGNDRLRLDRDTIGELDSADIKTFHIAVNPSPWQNDNGEWRQKAYLKTLYIVLEEDEFAYMYNEFDQVDDGAFMEEMDI